MRRSLATGITHHLLGWPLLAFYAILLAACTDFPDPLISPDHPPSYSLEPDCGKKTNPCVIDGLVAVGRNNTPNPPFTACTSTPGGCFPPDGSVIWGPSPAGGTSDGGRPQTYPTGSWIGSRPPSASEKAEIGIAIREVSRCLHLGNALSSRMTAGKIRMVDYEYLYGAYHDADDTIYLSTIHWDPALTPNTHAELVDTLIHEAIHAWFGGESTSDDEGENPYHTRAHNQCSQ